MAALAAGRQARSAEIEAIFADLDRSGEPGVVVAVAQGGTPVYRRGFGALRWGEPEPLTAATRMAVGSLTKPFVALACLALSEAGRLRLDEPVGRRLPDLDGPAAGVTPAELLTHVSGLLDPVDLAFVLRGPGRRITAEEVLSLYARLEGREAPAGEAWSYSNAGYVLLGRLLEAVEGAPLEAVLQARVFEPLGMKDTSLRRWDDDPTPGIASLHMPVAEGVFSHPVRLIEGLGQGGVWSTADDLLQWLRALGRSDILSPQSWRRMMTPPSLRHGGRPAYGLGLVVDRYAAFEVLSHPGGVMGANAQAIRVPALDLDVVVLSNRNDVSSILLANRVLDAYGVSAGRSPASPTAGPSGRALYRSRDGRRIVELDGAARARLDGADIPLEAWADGGLRPAEVRSYVKQTLELCGPGWPPAFVRLDDHGALETLHPVPPFGGKAGALPGRWRAAGIDLEALVAEDLSEAHFEGADGGFAYALEPLAAGVMALRVPGAVGRTALLALDADGGALRLFNGRVRNFPLVRITA